MSLKLELLVFSNAWITVKYSLDFLKFNFTNYLDIYHYAQEAWSSYEISFIYKKNSENWIFTSDVDGHVVFNQTGNIFLLFFTLI